MTVKHISPHYLYMLLVLVLGSCKEQKQQAETLEPETAKPNFIIYLTDDLGYGDLGCYGNPIIKTPGIDQFASEGVLLTDCHSAGTVCSPSRSGLLTGRNPYRSGFYYIQGAYGAHLQDQETTIAEVLKDQGYETAFMGKWHLSRLEKSEKHDEPDPGVQGFDYWFASTHNAFSGPKNYDKFLRNGKEVGEVDGWYCDVLTREAQEWLTKIRDKSKPFLLVVSTHEPHTPIAPPEKFSKMYDSPEVDSLEQTIKYGGVDRTTYDISQNKKEYYGTVSQLDAAFSALMKTVDDENLTENTMVVLTSDNGPEHPVNLEESRGEWEEPIRDYCFGTPGIYRGMKRYPYEGGHRVPGIVRYPAQIPAGTKSDKLIVATDFLPIFAKLSGAELPTDITLDGVDGYRALFNEEVERNTPYLWIFPTHEDTYYRMPHMAMRYGDYTLLGWFPEKTGKESLIEWMKSSVPEKFALYNLESDPSQEKDISKEEGALLEKLKPIMIAQWKEIRDEGPDWSTQ